MPLVSLGLAGYGLYKGAQAYGNAYGHTQLGRTINSLDPNYMNGQRGRSMTGDDEFDVALEQQFQAWAQNQPMNRRTRDLFMQSPEYRLFEKGFQEHKAKTAEGNQYRDSLSEFLTEMEKPYAEWENDPDVVRMRQSIEGSAAMGVSDRGFGPGGLADTAVARASKDALLGMQANRQALAMQARQAGLQDTQFLDNLREGQHRFDVDQATQMYGHQMGQRQAIGSAVGGIGGALIGGAIGSAVPGVGTAVGVGLGGSVGSQMGGGLAGATAPNFNPPSRPGGGGYSPPSSPYSGRNY